VIAAFYKKLSYTFKKIECGSPDEKNDSRLGFAATELVGNDTKLTLKQNFQFQKLFGGG
jgi:hypothetical protein